MELRDDLNAHSATPLHASTLDAWTQNPPRLIPSGLSSTSGGSGAPNTTRGQVMSDMPYTGDKDREALYFQMSSLL